MKPTPRRLPWLLTSTMTLALGIAPRAAFAWKPLTHADQARQAVAALPDDNPLMAKLAANIQYVYAGSSGPDIYYALLFDPASILGDLAHYCQTDALVENLKKAAAGNPRLEALAFGWASHNVADSVAHPWVNGFVGSAFTGGGGRSLIPGTINHLHGQLEAWVNRDFTGGMDQSAFDLAICLYATDPDVKSMVGQAFQDTYGDVFLAFTEKRPTSVPEGAEDFSVIPDDSLSHDVPVRDARHLLYKPPNKEDNGTYTAKSLKHVPLDAYLYSVTVGLRHDLRHERTPR